MPRTHTVFFNEDQLQSLEQAHTELEADFNDRLPYLDQDVRKRVRNRLSNLRIAIDLLGEEAD